MEKIWLKHYDAGVPEFISVDKSDSLVAYLERAFSNFPTLPAFANFGVKLSYQDIDEKSKRFAHYLQSRGYQKGDRFAIMLPNILQYPIAMFGVLRAGLIVVNVNPLYTAFELAHQLKDSGAKGILMLSNLTGLLAEAPIKELLPGLEVIVTDLGDEMPFLKRHVFSFVLKYIKKLVPNCPIDTVVRYRNIFTMQIEKPYESPSLHGDDIAYLQYTGGTTGVAKGAMLTHYNILCNVAQVYAWAMPFFSPTRRELMVTALPLYHVFSLTVNLWSFMCIGVENHLITNPRDIPALIKSIKKIGFTTTTGVNTLFNALVNHPNFPSVDFSHVKFVIAGGMALQAGSSEKWKAITGSHISQGYGLTETSPVVCAMPISCPDFTGSIGLPFPSTEMKIIDDKGNTLSAHHEGELCIRGPQVMKGYWNNPAATLEIIDNEGWLKTGDMAKMDEEGYVYLVDRKKNMIIVSGFNVYPNEVEAVIAEIPGVAEVAVIGVPDEKTHERVKAFVVKKDQSLTAQTIVDYCHTKLTRYKVPKSVVFKDELPKSNVGKILHRMLREEK